VSRLGRSRPLYVRVLRLKHLRLGGFVCGLLFEGVMAAAVLLSLAELVTWWSVLILPVTVAAVVKINDLVAGAFTRTDITMRFTTRRRPGSSARGTASVPTPRKRREQDQNLDTPTEIIPRMIRRRGRNQRRFTPPTRGQAADPSANPAQDSDQDRPQNPDSTA